ncbi:MAG: TolC family protein [Planctomycetia bacterium]|jgi:cobalt-zinc-cadmium efflux system outer membrane protein
MKTISSFRNLALVGLLAVAPKGAAADLSLESAVQTALMSNRDLLAARFAVHKAEGRLRQAGLLPNPELEFNGFSDFVSSTDGEGEFVVGLHQELPLTSRLSISREISRVGVAEALREVRNYERLLISRVQALYVRSQAARLRAGAAGTAKFDAAKSAELAATRLSAGQGTLAESALARVEEQRWGTMATTASTEAETLLLDLKTALGMSAGEPLMLSESLDSVLRTLQSRANQSRPSYRPDVELALLALDRAGAETRLAKASAWEGVRVGIEYMQDRGVDAPGGIDTGYFLGVKVSLPLPVWDQKKGEIQASQAAEEERAARVRALELEVANGIAAARRRVALLDTQWRRYGSDTQPVIDGAGREMAQGFEEGRVDARDLLLVRAQSASLGVEAARIIEDLALALIELEAVGGTHPAVAAPYVEEKPLHRRNKKS